MTFRTLTKTKKDNEVAVIRPVVNICEKDNDIELTAEMPGINKEDLSVEVKGDELCIRAKRTIDIPKGYEVLVQERGALIYERVFTVGNQVDARQIKASYKDGLLYVVLKKTEEAQPKKIPIS